ncbi:MAG: hypothetical protein AAGE52_21110 [Myxococcota bacterium]
MDTHVTVIRVLFVAALATSVIVRRSRTGVVRVRGATLWLLAVLVACGGGEPSTDAALDVAADVFECIATCDLLNERRCSDGPERCMAVDGCLQWVALDPCEASAACIEGECVACSETGTFRNQPFEVDGEERTYFLHVPDSVACGVAAPLWVDFHGTATDAPEVAYNLAEQIAIANREGALLLRPRSRFRTAGAFDVYQWDASPGDLEVNVRFVRALVADVEGRYAIDADRRYASGFSSGTNMAAQFLGDAEPRFRGYGFVAGGVWTPGTLRSFIAQPARVYSVTGFRDYIHPSWRTLEALLAENAFPADDLFVRETDTGHEQYGWHLEEMWRWMDAGERPESAVDSRWTPEDTGSTRTLLEAARHPDGPVLVVGAEGTVLRRGGEGWASVATLGDAYLTGVCMDDTGAGLIAGDGQVAVTDDGGESWKLRRAPTGFPGAMLSTPFLNAAACPGDGRLVAAGYWLAVETTDGESFDEVAMPNGFGGNAQAASLAVSPTTGTTVAAGYFNYIARRVDEAFVQASPPASRPWYSDVSVSPDGTFWVAGDRGAVYRSEDDGVTWRERSPDSDEDLYAVAAEGDLVVAVGAHGAAFVSLDQGATWEASVLGDGVLADVVFLDEATVLAVGEDGAAFRRNLRE